MTENNRPTSTTEISSEPERFLTHSNKPTIKAVIRGMQNVERVESWLRDDIAKLKRKGEFMMPETGMLRVT